MNKITMLCGSAALACLLAPPIDGGGASTPLLDSTNHDAAAEAAAAETAAAEAATALAAAAAAATKVPAARPAAARPRTQARLDPAKKPVKAGARPRRAKGAENVETEKGEIVGIVLRTSRVTGADGRAIPRRTVALAKSGRADTLIGRGWARAATDAETATATVVLD